MRLIVRHMRCVVCCVVCCVVYYSVHCTWPEGIFINLEVPLLHVLGSHLKVQERKQIE